MRETQLIAVNNAGSSHEMPVAFADTTPEELETIVQVVSRCADQTHLRTPLAHSSSPVPSSLG